MPWVCRIVTNHHHASKPGDMWRSEWRETKGHWLVLLPSGMVHDINGNSKAGKPWRVSGQAPKFTVTPSIDSDEGKGWHGWLRDGVLSDDVGGKKY